ncbi:MAG TPA: hypothetical protein VIJ75_10800 [Hanamia sp.]
MTEFNFEADIEVFGFPANSFPAGIGDAFEILIQKTGDRAGTRNYYGLSNFKNEKIVYYALAEEKFHGEAEKYNYEKFNIEKGNYLTVSVFDWQKKTNSIKDIFSEIILDPRVNKTKPAIEWYKSEDEMMCLVQMND